MARIYIVQYEQGTYGDYRCFDIKAFVKKDNALKFAETKNKLVELFSNNISTYNKILFKIGEYNNIPITSLTLKTVENTLKYRNISTENLSIDDVLNMFEADFDMCNLPYYNVIWLDIEDV